MRRDKRRQRVERKHETFRRSVPHHSLEHIGIEIRWQIASNRREKLNFRVYRTNVALLHILYVCMTPCACVCLSVSLMSLQTSIFPLSNDLYRFFTPNKEELCFIEIFKRQSENSPIYWYSYSIKSKIQIELSFFSIQVSLECMWKKVLLLALILLSVLLKLQFFWWHFECISPFVFERVARTIKKSWRISYFAENAAIILAKINGKK